jgi:hypothetical protein
MAEYGLDKRRSCRKLSPDGVPVCPVRVGSAVHVQPCEVPHCAEKVFGAFGTGIQSGGSSQGQPWDWGLSRVFNRWVIVG